MIDAVKWCNLCNSRPADGMLQAQLVEDGPVENLDVCTPCVTDIPKENWYEPGPEFLGEQDGFAGRP
jgi:hypothetical protein